MSVFKRLSWQAIGTRLILAVLALGTIVAFPGDTPAGNSLDDRVIGQAGDDLFNYVAWEADAIASKIEQQSSGLAAAMTEAQRSRYVHNYLQQVAKLQSLDSQIDALYSDPSISDPDAASADLRARRDPLQAQVDQQQPLAESIIEGQVASVLRDEGLATLGEVLPPVSAHITELPMMLVISPRDKIRFETAVNVVNLPINQIVDLENRIDHDLNVSSLVVPLGGLSLYPSMVIQTWYAPSVFEVVAHEWTHHYLYFFPLGLDYEAAADTRTINETTASLLGDEIAVKVLRRFYGDYPDIVDQLRQYTESPASKPSAAPANPNTPPPFDYGATMNETRITVDSLLAKGQIEEAERYMEQQRRVFVAHGYRIRKLNQAYFAFYGGYQSAEAGAGGADPIGPAIAEIRQRSPSLKAWLETMRVITGRDQLLAVRDELRRAQ
jgi:hypothetical protein